jgi:hypothetical protein
MRFRFWVTKDTILVFFTWTWKGKNLSTRRQFLWLKSLCNQNKQKTENSRDPRSYMKKWIADLLRLRIDRVNWIVSSCVKLQLHKALVMHSVLVLF